MAIDAGGAVRAQAVLQSACRTLLSTSSDVVAAFSLSISPHEAGGSLEDWVQVAHELAEKYELQVEVTVPRKDIYVRFSRYGNGRHAR
ncbi:MAG: hypothetical protein ABI559_08445 [Chloroflexota bacterium]